MAPTCRATAQGQPGTVELEEIFSGEPAVRARFVREHAGLVYAAIHRGLGEVERGLRGASDRAELIEDLFAEVFVALFDRDARRLRLWDGRCSLASWLTIVAVSVVRDHARRVRRRAALQSRVERMVEAPDEPAVEALVEVEAQARLRVAMERLSKADRDLLQALVERGEPAAEVAQRLGVQLGALYTRKNRALGRLRALYEALERGGL